MNTETLTTRDREMFLRIGISQELLDEAGVQRVSDAEARQFGIMYASASDLSGIYFPYLRPADGQRVTGRLRRDNPEIDSKGASQNKYIAPWNDARHLYFPPRSREKLADVSIPVVFVEAEKSALALVGFAERNNTRLLPMGCGGCWGWRGRIGKAPAPDGTRVDVKGPLPDFDCIQFSERRTFILFDANVAHNAKVQDARNALARELKGRNAQVFFATVPNLSGVNGPDDLIALRGDEALRSVLETANTYGVATGPKIRAVTLTEFLEMKIQPRSFVLEPILPTQGLGMVYAYRGVGKTYFVLSLAYAIATGGKFLRWSAPKPRRVLYLDGEMPAVTQQERIASIVAGTNSELPGADYLKIVTPDLQTGAMPDLATADGQAMVEDLIGDAEVLIVDNISTLCRSGKENDAYDWTPMQAWVLSLRRRGLSCELVHHAGKNMAQRGTSKREDILDTVISLRRPTDYREEEGLRCEVIFEKTRGFYGPDAAPFGAAMETMSGGAVAWTMTNLEDAREVKIRELTALDMSIREIEQELQIPKSTIHRIQKKMRLGVPNGR